MSTHYDTCPQKLLYETACDLSGPLENLCEDCLTRAIREKRPEGWSPRFKQLLTTIKKEDTREDHY